MIPLSILELSFVVAVGPHYIKHTQLGNLKAAFFRVNSILCFLFVLMEIFRILIDRSIFVSTKLPFYSFWTPLNYVNSLGGLLLGMVFAVLTLMGFQAKS